MPVSEGLHEAGGGGVVGAGGGNHLEHRDLCVLVGRGQRDGSYPVDRQHLFLEVGD